MQDFLCQRSSFGTTVYYVLTCISFGASSGPGKGMDDRENRRRMKSTPKRALPAGRDSSEIDFELPLCSKYLLLAAYIASRNAATLDASLFDTGDGARASSRKKRKWASIPLPELPSQKTRVSCHVSIACLIRWIAFIFGYGQKWKHSDRLPIFSNPPSGVFRIVCFWSP